MIDIGWQDGPYGLKQQVVLCFEFPTETVNVDGRERPMIMSEFYSTTISKKARLRRDLESWRGRTFNAQELDGFELKNVIGKQCTITTFENENGRTRISAISPAMKGVEHKLHNEPIFFDLDLHGVNSSEFHKVPEWLRDIIGKRAHPPESENPAPSGTPDFDDDIPF